MNKLIIHSTLTSQAIIEFAALCVSGWVTSNKIESAGFAYLIDTADGSHHITPNKTSKKSHADLTDELLLLLLCFSLLDSKIDCLGDWSCQKQIEHAINWIKTGESACKPLSINDQIHQFSNLTLIDLTEVHDLFENKECSIKTTMCSTKFPELFPFSNVYDATHASLRHVSGNECYITFEDEDSPIKHKFDAPCPADFIFNEWRSAFEGKKAPRFQKKTSKPKSYYRSSNDRWKIAKMIGEIPTEHKKRVFSWVNETIRTVDSYHDSRGSDGPLPEKFEITFGEQKLIATQELVFSFAKE